MNGLTIRKEVEHLKTVLRVVASTTPPAERADRTVIMLAYASLGLHFPGTAPTKTVQLARCIVLLRACPWMRQPAFDYLSRLAGSAWPYVIKQWDRLEAILDGETDCSLKPEAYAPATFALLHDAVARRCSKPFCSHPMEDHAFEMGEFKGSCSVPGCVCHFYAAPRLEKEPSDA